MPGLDEIPAPDVEAVVGDDDARRSGVVPVVEPVPVEGLAPLKPSDEAALHARIAATTGAGAVVHVHPLAAVLAGRRS